MILGEAVVRLVGDDSEFRAMLDGAAGKMDAAGKRMTGVGKTMSVGITAPIVAAGAALFATAVKTGAFADELLDLSDATGLSTDSIQRFRAVAVEAGVSTDVVTDAALKMTRQMAAGDEGSAKLQSGMESLGISLTDAAGNMRPVGELTEEAIVALAGMEDQSKRNVLATQLFGGSAKDLAPILAMGADAIQDITASAEDYGGVMSREALEAANEFRAGMDQLQAQIGNVVREIGVAAIPIFKDMVSFLSESVVPVVRRVVDWFASIPGPIQKTIVVFAGLLAAAGPVLVVLGTVVSAASALIPVFAAIVPVVSAVAAVFAGPFLVPLAAAAAAIIAVVVAFRNWDVIVGFVGDVVRGVVGFVSDVLGGVLDYVLRPIGAVVAGFQLWERIPVIVGEMVTGVVNLIRGALTSALDFILGPIRAVGSAFAWLFDVVVGNSYVPDMVDGIEQQFARLPSVMVDPALNATRQVSGAFGLMATEVEAAAKRVGGAFEDFGAGGASVGIITDALGIRLGGQAGERQRVAQEAAGHARARQTGWHMAGSGPAWGSSNNTGATPIATGAPGNPFGMLGMSAPSAVSNRSFGTGGAASAGDMNVSLSFELPNITDRSSAEEILNDALTAAERVLRMGGFNPFVNLRET